MNNPWKWDGSFLGAHKINIILQASNIEELNYFHISINGYETYCMYRETKDNLSCIIDELKPIFKIIKLGTHDIIIGRTHYLLVRCAYYNNEIIYDHKLSDISEYLNIKQTNYFYQKVQEVFVFRELLGLSQTFESSVRVRYHNCTYYPISFREGNSHLEKENSVVPLTILNKWFKDEDLSIIARRMLSFSDLSERFIT